MPVKLQLSFNKSVPQGDVATICLVGGDGALMPRLDGDVAAQLIAAMTTARFKGKVGKSLTVYTSQSCFILIGVGDELAPGAKAEDVGGALFAALEKTATRHGWLPDQGVLADELADVCFGAMLASYHFNAYFTGDQDNEMVRLSVGSNLLDAKTPLVVDRQALATGVFLARDLVFEPANKLYPEAFAARCLALEDTGLAVEVLDEPALKKLGMGALLGVGQGSRRESRVVVMRWQGGGEEAPIALIGKGVTFDTGGISLKPAKGMEDMKWDMGGAAAVTGAMCAIAGRKLSHNVIGIIGLVENMPDGNAQRPGDVVTSMAGKTIEVINTDAEGRLVLADIIHYAQTRFAPRAMVDLATLTGAIIGALGKEYAGLFTNSDELAGQLAAAGDTVGEAVWRMPMGPAYDRMLKSHIADVKNIGGPYGGAITAACFLGRFVDNVPWAHLDIAGKAWSDAAKPTVPKGGTGYGVRLLNRMIDEWHDVTVTDKSDDV